MEHEAKISPLFFPSIFVNFWRNTSIKFCGILITFHEWSYYPANICLDEDVLIKTNMFALALLLQKTSWSGPIYSSWLYVFKTSWRRFQDVFKTSCKTSSRSLQDVLKTSWKTTSRHFQDVFKTSCKDIFKTFARHIIKLNCSC